MSLSLYNSTTIPLASNEIFIGLQYDNILDFAEINLSIKCDKGYTMTYIYSQDKLSVDYEVVQIIPYNADTQFYTVDVKDRYFKLKIQATDGKMNILNVQTIYKSVPTYASSGGTVDANITNSLLDVSDADTHTKLDSIVTGLQNNNKGSVPLWVVTQTGVNGVSTGVNLSTINQSNLTFYGYVDNTTNIIVQFSYDGNSYYDSQYSYSQTGAGDIGFNILSSPNYVRLKSSNDVLATVFLNYN